MSVVRAWSAAAIRWAWVAPASALALVAVSSHPAGRPYAATRVVAFGVYGALGFVLLALAVVTVGSLSNAAAQPKSAAPPRTVLQHGVWVGLAFVLVSSALGAALVPLVPHSLAARDAIARCVAWYVSLPLLVIPSWLVWRARSNDRAYPAWLWAVLHMLSRLVMASDLALFAEGREAVVDLVSMVLVFAALAASGASLPRFPRALGWLTAATALAVIASLSMLNQNEGTRTALARDQPGATGMLVAARSLFDLDGDGFASVLGGNDCDDSNPRTNPAAVEIVGNGIDDNCSGGDLAAYTPDKPPSRRPDARGRNVLLITIDAMRADVSAGDGGGPPAMPEYRRFGANGSAVFPRAYVQAPYTTDSLQSLITGSYPMSMTFGPLWLGSEPDLPRLLRAAGYATQAVHSLWLKDPDTGVVAETTTFLLGFEHVDRSAALVNREPTGVTSAMLTDSTLAHFDRLRQDARPFLLWVHYFDLHAEYVAHPGTPFSGTTPRDRYLQEAWSTDVQLGRLLRHVEDSGFLENGLVVITGDHGELLGEDDRYQHAYWMDEECLRTSVTLRGQGVESGRFETRVRLIDLAPTILELAASIQIHRAGRSLAPIWQGREQGDRDVYARSLYDGRVYKRAILQGSWKLVQDIRGGTTELFDLRDDPAERINLAEARGDVRERLMHQLGQTFDRAVNDQLLQAYRRRPTPGSVAGAPRLEPARSERR